MGGGLSATETYLSFVDSAALRPGSSRRCACWGPASWHTEGAYDLVTSWHVTLGGRLCHHFPPVCQVRGLTLTGCFVYHNFSFLVCFVVSCVHLLLTGRPWCTLSQTPPGHDCWPLSQSRRLLACPFLSLGVFGSGGMHGVRCINLLPAFSQHHSIVRLLSSSNPGVIPLSQS